MSVPMTTLTAVTRRDWPTVSWIAAMVCGLVSGRCSRTSRAPAEVTTAVSGISTRRLNQVSEIAESERGPGCQGRAPPARRPGGVGRRRRTRSAAGGHSDVSTSCASEPEFSMRCGITMPSGLAVLAVGEELLRRLAPAAEVTVDGVQLRRSRERVGRVVGTLDLGELDAVDTGDRAEAEAGVDLLAVGDVEEVEEVLRTVLRVLGDRGRVLDEQRVVRDDVVDVLTVLLGEDRLVLVG